MIDSQIKTKVITGYSIILFLMVCVSTIAYNSIKSLNETSKWVQHTYKVIETGNAVGTSMLNMETGKRGYLITGEESYLEPYYIGFKNFERHINEGPILTSDNPAQIVRWNKIKVLKEKWLIESVEPGIKLRKEVNKGDIAISSFKKISGKISGKELFDDIRTKLSVLSEKANKNEVLQSIILQTTLSLVNMETGQRGFLLTGSESSLDPYIQGEKDLIKSLADLSKTLSESSIELNDIESVLHSVIKWKTDVADVEIEARREMNKYKYTLDDITLMLSQGIGKGYMDMIRIVLNDIIKEEESLLSKRMSNQENSARFSTNFTLFGTILALAFGVTIAVIISRNIYLSLQESKKKDQLLLQQSKQAAMGEMIGAIAHQWRQPLNALAIQTQFIEDDYEDGLIDKEYLQKYSKENMKMITFMSKTIDDFRNFFTIDKMKKSFSVYAKIKDTSNMLLSQLENYEIELTVEENDFIILGFESEFQQVILNLVNNAKDALLENSVKSPKIGIYIQKDEDMGVVKIKDNAGGVPKDVIQRIFEPYFTTKEEGKGTGVGLYMSKMIIEDNMGGSIHVENENDGAVFTIKLHLNAKD